MASSLEGKVCIVTGANKGIGYAAAQDGSPYVFDPTVGPGYVWHCHIIDHEDNEMMRPYIVAKP